LKEVQTHLRAEILSTNTPTPTSDVVNALPYLTAVVYELLRLYPPVSQLINRVTVRPAMLGNEIPIPAGTFVGWNAYGVHVNPGIWGPDANEFKPERWGRTVGEMHARFRRETVRGTYIPFNAHSRKCLEWTVDPGYRLKMTPVSLLTPGGCRVLMHDRAGFWRLWDAG
jgi:unspecific monooxygenase